MSSIQHICSLPRVQVCVLVCVPLPLTSELIVGKTALMNLGELTPRLVESLACDWECGGNQRPLRLVPFWTINDESYFTYLSL